MKKIVPVFAFLALAVLWTSCKNSNSPQAVTEKFLVSFSKMDYTTAKNLSTQNTWAMLDILASFTKEMPEAEKNALFQNFKVKVTDSKKESDSTMIVTYVTEPKILPFNKLRLLQQKDLEGNIRWKVDISTLDLVGGEESYIEEEHQAEVEEVQRDAVDTVKVDEAPAEPAPKAAPKKKK